MCIPRNISLPFPTPVRIIQLAMKAVPLQLLFCLVYTGSLFSSIDNDKACLSLCVTSVLPSVYTVDCSLQDSPQVSVSLGWSITGQLGDGKQQVGIGTARSVHAHTLNCWSATGFCPWFHVIYNLYFPSQS